MSDGVELEWDFEPIKKWVEEASTTTGDVKWDALKKWLDKCEAKFNELGSEVEERDDKIRDMEHRIEDMDWTEIQFQSLKEMLADIPRGIVTGRELMDSVDLTEWQRFDGDFLDPAKTGKLMVASERRF